MTQLRYAALGDVCEVKRGTTITQKQTRSGNVPVVAGGIEPSYFHDVANRAGNVVTISASGANAGFVNFWEQPIFASDCSTVEAQSTGLDIRYVYNFLRFKQPDINALRSGAAQPHVYAKDIALLQIPLLPLAEQRGIVDVLARAEGIVRLRREAQQKTAELIPALFLDLFGDPAINPKHWPTTRLGDLAVKMSDGPFGSNLKSSHYVDSGVRVIRLQNTGIGDLIDDDKAYVTEEHYASLPRNHCHPGDVIIGTLGDPNLRAFVLPDWLTEALNKADCVQFRCNSDTCDPVYICWLMNMPSTLSMASSMVQGITRNRISMGRLRGLEVPVPPIELQRHFAAKAEAVRSIAARQSAALATAQSTFDALLHRAFAADSSYFLP